MFKTIQSELDATFSKIDKEFFIKAGHISKFVPNSDIYGPAKCLLPALVILPAKLFKGCAEKAIIMASVVQFIIIAQIIHNRVPDDCSKEVPQFPVLVGDYFFSKYFKILSDNNFLEWLSPLASVICEMNEGAIVRQEVLEKGMGTKEEYLSVVRREYGLLAAQACKIGGAIAKVRQDVLEALELFGLHVGMAWGIIAQNFPLSPQEFLEKAKQQLISLPPGPERDAMLDMVNHIKEKTHLYQSSQWEAKSAISF